VQKEKVSYAIGMDIGQNLKRRGFEVDVDVLANAMKDIFAGKTPKYTEQESRQTMQTYMADLRTKKDRERVEQAALNKKLGEEFLAANKKKDGVQTKMVDCGNGQMGELQYKILKEGSGTPPKSNDVVSVNYRGTLISGKEFDNSAKRGQPMKQPANSFIRGWNEALPMMKPGAKWELYVPSTLAYGDFQRGEDIQPGSTLIFEVELVSAEPAPPPPPAPAPLTSDIIKVPSKQEMEKGAKIEILKPEEAARLAAEQEKAAKK
jgi:FKBP-type peptidyl-prolyl cis-trans isomerase FklB